jgi:hypothetical protein
MYGHFLRKNNEKFSYYIYLCCDCAVVILVEDSESLFEGCQLVGGQGFQDPFPVSLAKGCHSEISYLLTLLYLAKVNSGPDSRVRFPVSLAKCCHSEILYLLTLLYLPKVNSDLDSRIRFRSASLKAVILKYHTY